MIVDLVIFVILTAIMFAPTFIAYNRKLKRRFACFWVNLFLGWTIIFWLPLWAWSMLSSSTES